MREQVSRDRSLHAISVQHSGLSHVYEHIDEGVIQGLAATFSVAPVDRVEIHVENLVVLLVLDHHGKKVGCYEVPEDRATFVIRPESIVRVFDWVPNLLIFEVFGQSVMISFEEISKKVINCID